MILAGGRGTRMRPATNWTPKTLLPVAGRPFADHQLGWLVAHGVTDIVYCVGHHGRQVRRTIGDGRWWWVRIVYVDESDRRLGTGGALRFAYDQGVLESAFLVVYGDSYLTVDVRQVWRAYRQQSRPAMVTVYRNQGQWEHSNMTVHDGLVTRYDKTNPDPSMDHIDCGLAVLSYDLIGTLPTGPSDLGDLYHQLADRGQVAAYPLADRFYEIGSPAGLADLADHLGGRGTG